MRFNYLYFFLLLMENFCFGQNFNWAINLQGNTRVRSSIIQSDQAGNVYIAGCFEDTVDFDPGVGIFTLTANNEDIYMAKYGPNGNFIWAKSIGAISSDICFAFKLDAQSNLYIAGSYAFTVDFDPGPGVSNHTSTYWDDIYFAKYDSSGNYVWSKALTGSNLEHAFGIDLDSSGNIYLTGGFLGTTDFDPGPATYSLTPNSADVFLAKYDNFGNFVYAKQITSLTNGDKYAECIKVKPSGNIILSGWFKQTADFDPGPGTTSLTSAGQYDIFVAEYSNNGNLIWVNRIGNVNDDRSSSMVLDSNGDIYLSGMFGGTVDFDPGQGNTTLTASNSQSNFLAKYNSFGQFIFAKGFSGTTMCCNTSYLDIGSNGNICVTGNFIGTEDFDPGPGTYTLSSNGYYDVFLLVVNSVGAFVSVQQFGNSSYDYAHSILTTSQNIFISGTFKGVVDFDFSAATANLTANSDNLYLAKYAYPLIPVNVKENMNSASVAIYPNPSPGYFTVNLGNIDKPCHIRILNSLGQRIFDQGYLQEAVYVDISNNPNGVYFVTFSNDQGYNYSCKKVVISSNNQ